MMHVNQVRISRTAEQNKSTHNEYLNQHKGQKKNVDSWEEDISERYIEDIREDIFEKYLERVRQTGRLAIECADGENREDILNRLFLVRGNRLKNAGAVLFCDNDQCELQMAVFTGTDRDELHKTRRCRGAVFELVDAAEEFVREYYYTDTGTAADRRRDFYGILHEVLMNSFCHRDFNSRQCNELLIFSDRMEIYNPGIFPESCKPEDYAGGGYRPVKRNPLLDSVLYYSGDTNGLGMGLHRIVKACEKAGIGLEFRKEALGFAVIFREDSLQEEKQAYSDSVDLCPINSVDLTTKEMMIISYLQTHEAITNAAARKITGVGTTAARNLLNGLVAKRYLEASGEHRGRKYHLIQRHEMVKD